MFSLKKLFTKKVKLVENPAESWRKVALGVNRENEVVYWDIMAHPHIAVSGPSGSGKTNLLETILTHCIQNGDKIRAVGIDMYKNEMQEVEKYEPAVLGVAKTTENALEACRFAHEYMMKNYEKMEDAGANHFLDLEEKPHLLLLVMDEMYTILKPYGDEEDSLKEEMKKILLDIARLGRAAGVQIVLSSQQINPDIIADELYGNIANHVSMGADDYSAPGHGLLKAYADEPIEFQAYRADLKALDEYFSELEVKTDATAPSENVKN